jgi:hypothetical protein
VSRECGNSPSRYQEYLSEGQREHQEAIRRSKEEGAQPATQAGVERPFTRSVPGTLGSRAGGAASAVGSGATTGTGPGTMKGMATGVLPGTVPGVAVGATTGAVPGMAKGAMTGVTPGVPTGAVRGTRVVRRVPVPGTLASKIGKVAAGAAGGDFKRRMKRAAEGLASGVRKFLGQDDTSVRRPRQGDPGWSRGPRGELYTPSVPPGYKNSVERPKESRRQKLSDEIAAAAKGETPAARSKTLTQVRDELRQQTRPGEARPNADELDVPEPRGERPEEQQQGPTEAEQRAMAKFDPIGTVSPIVQRDMEERRGSPYYPMPHPNTAESSSPRKSFPDWQQVAHNKFVQGRATGMPRGAPGMEDVDPGLVRGATEEAYKSGSMVRPREGPTPEDKVAAATRAAGPMLKDPAVEAKHAEIAEAKGRRIPDQSGPDLMQESARRAEAGRRGGYPPLAFTPEQRHTLMGQLEKSYQDRGRRPAVAKTPTPPATPTAGPPPAPAVTAAPAVPQPAKPVQPKKPEDISRTTNIGRGGKTGT